VYTTDETRQLAKLRRSILAKTPASAARIARANGIAVTTADGRVQAPALVPAAARLAAEWGARVRPLRSCPPPPPPGPCPDCGKKAAEHYCTFCAFTYGGRLVR
jgi:hypothetical protein